MASEPSAANLEAFKKKLQEGIVAEETARGEQMFKRLSDAIEIAPFFLCSTHGAYDRKENPVKWTVPENTFIFETQEIGDLTLTGLDIPLWELLQGGRRWGFMKYLTLAYDEIRAITGAPAGDTYKQVFANCILYKPGDTIYERVLSIGGGRGLNSSSRNVYAGMGFFRFDARGPAYEYRGYGRARPGESKGPYEVLPSLQRQMVEDGRREITNHSFVEYVNNPEHHPKLWRNGTPMEGIDFRNATPKGLSPAHPRIFIFSSCAAVDDEQNPEGTKRWKKVVKLQKQREIEAATDLGIYSLLGFTQYGSNINNAGVSRVEPDHEDPGGGTTLSSTSGLHHKKSQLPAEFFVRRTNPDAIRLYSLADSDLHEGYLYLTRSERKALEQEESRKQAALESAEKKGGRRTRRFRIISKRTIKGKTKSIRRTR